jgi:hypothetical protein
MVAPCCPRTWCSLAPPALDDGEPEKKVLVANGYLDTHAPVVRERMVMAGVRLGGLLNQALGAQTPETSLRTEMLGRIETIMPRTRRAEERHRSDQAVVVTS